MSYPILHAPQWTGLQAVQFISDDNPSLSITTSQNQLANNPSALKIVTGSNVKVDQDLIGMAHVRGSGETPPFSLQLEWKIMGFNDYLNLAALRPYLITFITFRGVGYYGNLVMDGPESVAGSADTVHATGNFYPISPSDDGGAAAVSRIPDPTSFAVGGDGGAGSGGIPAYTYQYYWFTFSSEYGETNPQGPISYYNTQDMVAVNITWNWPSTPHCQYATLYNSEYPFGSNPKIVAQIPAAMTATWTDYVGLAGLTVAQALPLESTAYKGTWQAGIWFNGS